MNKFYRILIIGLLAIQANVASAGPNISSLPQSKNEACKAYWGAKVESIRFQNSVKTRIWNFVIAPIGLAAVQSRLPGNVLMRSGINLGLYFAFSYLSDKVVDFVDQHVYSVHAPVDETLKVAQMGDALQKTALEECDKLFPKE